MDSKPLACVTELYNVDAFSFEMPSPTYATDMLLGGSPAVF
jgi:hypothetical protein